MKQVCCVAAMLPRQKIVQSRLLKPIDKEVLVQMDLQMAWKTRIVCLVHFAHRTGGEVATFTAHNLTVNAS